MGSSLEIRTIPNHDGPVMRKLIPLFFLGSFLVACSKPATGNPCALDGDCKSGRNCWCDPATRTKDGACGTPDKDPKGTCLSEEDAIKAKQAAPAKK